MDKYTSAWRCKRSSIEVEGAVDLRPCGEFWVDSRRAKEVEGQQGLWKKAIPEMEWKVAIGGTETGDEMVLEGSDSAFGSVSAVNVRWDELKVDVLVCHVCFEGSGGFVVETLELRFEASGAEKSVRAFVCGEDFGPSLVFHGLDVDEIAVVFVYDEHVAVAVRGWLDEAPGEVGEDLPSGSGEVGVDVTGANG
jgi:hypothetical protein